MNIGIDARMSGTKHGGIGRYIEMLIFALPKLAPHDTFTIICKPDTLVPTGDNITIITTPIHWYGISEQLSFFFLINSLRVDIMHFPHWNVPLLYRKPYIVTIHDLILQHIPAFNATTHSKITYAIKHALYNVVLHNAAQTAQKILTVSEFSKQDIASQLHVPLEKIAVTPLCNTLIHKSTPRPTPYPYFLSVGVSYPHKNLDRLIRIFGEIHTKIPEHLVLIGPVGPFTQNLQNLITKLPSAAQEKIHQLHLVNNELLSTYYTNARALLFPSSYEGFGIPLLEAQAAGIPIIANNVTAIPEVAGDGALYTEDNDDAWKDAVLRMSHERELRETLIKNGHENEKKFTKEKLISSTYQNYHQIVKKGV